MLMQSSVQLPHVFLRVLIALDLSQAHILRLQDPLLGQLRQ